MGESLRKENRIYTYNDYISWPDDERWEIIYGKAYRKEGEVYGMSPGARASHQRVSRRILTEFEIYLRGKTCEVFHPPFDVVLPEDEENIETATNTVQPDIMVICDGSKIFQDKCCLGAPDLIIEILSKSTASNDMKKKRLLYEKFGVKEYWIVDPVHEIVQVYKLISPRKYGFPEVYTDGDKIKVGLFPELEIDLKMIFQ